MEEKQKNDPVYKLKNELKDMKPSALRKRALQDGATEAEVETAEDSKNPKAALIQLIVNKMPEGGSAAAGDDDGDC